MCLNLQSVVICGVFSAPLKSMDTTEGGYYAYGGGGGGYMQDSQAFGASPAGDSKKVSEEYLHTT